MTWTSRDLSGVCSQNSSHSACSPSYLAFMSFVIQYFGQSNDNYTSNVNNCGRPNDRYDFIIVGAGSAGCVLANRLSEIKKWRILLLEAGIHEPLVADVPAFASLIRGSNIDWNYRTQPEKNSCRSKIGQSCIWGRGKVMGGSSTLNNLMYIRGHPKDFDHWAELGNPGWSYKEVLPYFKKSEDNRTPDIVAANPDYHNKSGYQTVEYYPYTDPNSQTLIDAWEEIGYKNIDYNADNEHIGSLRIQMTSRNGERLSTNGAFIRPVINERPNLVVRTEAYVTKIIINPRTKQAIGVEYVLTNSSNTNTRRAYAMKEVIVSAGTINSPKLLMLSGIGPGEHLKELGIKVIQDSAVGKNLQDHPTLDGFIIKISEETSTLVDFDQMKQDSLEYLKTRSNLLSAMGTLSCGAFVRTDLEEISDYPDMQFAFAGINITDYMAMVEGSPGMAALPLSYYSGILVRPVVNAARSRGELKLNATDPTWGPPLIFPNYFGNSRDLEVLVAGIREAHRLFETEVFRKNGYSLLSDPLPACKDKEFDSDDYWRCVAVQYTNTIYHFTGTCKMGPRRDPDAVVDTELNVYGVKSLRVVDASIMPIITRGNTNAPTIMIAEKISDAIKNTWLRRKG